MITNKIRFYRTSETDNIPRKKERKENLILFYSFAIFIKKTKSDTFASGEKSRGE